MVAGSKLEPGRARNPKFALYKSAWETVWQPVRVPNSKKKDIELFIALPLGFKQRLVPSAIDVQFVD
jgi:hypothetical protein